MTCDICGKPKSELEFYASNKSKCKECVKARVMARRIEKIDEIRAYDRARGNRQADGYLKEYREKYPMKYKAHTIVNNAIRNKKLFSQPCVDCGCVKSVAHHDDYAKPLNVRWMCQAHHKQWHAINGEGLNAN